MKLRLLILVLSLALLPLASANARLAVDSVTGLSIEGTIEDGATLVIWIHLTQEYEGYTQIDAVDNGFWFWDDPDGSLSWGPLVPGENPDINWDPTYGFPCIFDMGFFMNVYGDTVGFGGVNFMTGTGIPYGWDDWAYTITIGPLTVNEEPATLYMDSCFYPPSNHWVWSASAKPEFKPDWVGGPYSWGTQVDVSASGGEGLPAEFSLRQNYPNPFNPATMILYDVPRRSHVSLVIYNALGQKVRTLVNETRGAGSYSVEWDGRNDGGTPVSTGVYLYRLEAGDYAQTKKAIMMK